jgi:murein DD-endopeptidase MepM/ murein hydrolase activator NlpD
MISSVRATALLMLIAAAVEPVGSAQAGWLDWGSAERTATRNDPVKSDAGKQQTIVVERGDTLGKIMARAGVLASESARVLEAMKDLVDPKRLQIGDTVVMTLGDAAGQIRLSALHVDFRPDVSLTLVRGQDGAFHPAGMISGKSTLVVETVTGKISKSLRGSLVQAGLPSTLADDVIKALDYDPTLPKRIKTGTEFQVIYERLGAQQGRKPGDRLRLRYAEVTIGKTPHRFYHYAPGGTEAKFFDENGRPLESIKFIIPIEGGKVNSPYGMRLHPVLRKVKLHKGVDFPAPKGTPIYAAADGVVEDMGWRGNYGNYIKVKHDARHDTAYGHLDEFAPGVAEGEWVAQGQVIGYVGRTGLASGNHLYWEVLVDNKQVDPMKVRMVKAGGLEGRELQKFQRFVKETHAQAVALR